VCAKLYLEGLVLEAWPEREGQLIHIVKPKGYHKSPGDLLVFRSVIDVVRSVEKISLFG
jgi:hypothetical protein